MTLKSQILALIAVPLLALSVMGWLQAKFDWGQYQSAQTTQSTSEVSTSLLSVVHTLQVERGLSAGYLGNAEATKPTPELITARAAVDTAIAAVPHNAQASLGHIAALPDARNNVTNKKVSVKGMGTIYSGMIANVMSDLSAGLLTIEDEQMTQLSVGLVNLTYAKESAGQQRAAGAAGFSAGRFNASVYRWFVEMGAAEAQLLNVADRALGQQLPELDLQTALAETGLLELRSAVIHTPSGASAPQWTSAEWFGRATDWINELRAVEMQITDRMTSLALQAAATAKRQLWISGVILVLCITLSLSIGILLITTFTKQFRALQDDLDKLAKKEFDFEPAHLNGRNEVSHLARSMEQTRLALSEAEDRLIEIEKSRNQDRGAFVARLEESLASLADGDLDCTIVAQFPEEYETLRISFNDSIANLRSTIQQVTLAAESITSGAAEISQAADHLSKRTEAQAATLEETAAALEEITTSVQSSADGAHTVEGTMTSARDEAHASGEVVRDAVTAMTAIEQSSTQIAQIIGVIDDIAFQTNLLALNAGVEAARAGSHGRGFAVVASEVRALAQKSAEAATEIKSLISDSSKQVQDGVSLVGETGTAITRIVDRVNEIAKLVGGISNGTVEQATGLREINQNVHQLDDVTQKNAAMVEESTAAGHMLHADASRLAELMGQFQVGAIGRVDETGFRRAS